MDRRQGTGGEGGAVMARADESYRNGGRGTIVGCWLCPEAQEGEVAVKDEQGGEW